MRVMTWNLWWRFGPFEQRHRAIIAVLRAVDPDILCLQEVWRDAADDQAELLANELGMAYVRTDPAATDPVTTGAARAEPADGAGASFGNAILSKWPLTTLASVELPSATGAFGPRRIVAAHADTPFGRWPVAATHFDYLFDASATRQLQAERLLELALEWRGDATRDPPLIVGADLNAVADSAEVQVLTGRRPGVDGIVFSDVWEQAGDGPGITWRSDNPHIEHSTWPNRRLDYLLVSWPRPKPVGNPQRAWLAGTEPVDIDGVSVWPSDHAAVVADITTPG